jgi:hypothetical protein
MWLGLIQGVFVEFSAESAARNKKLDPSPYKFMKNITPAELIAEKEVCVLWLCIGNGFYIAREIDRINFWSYVRHLKAYDLMTIHASILWDDYPPFKSFERVFSVFSLGKCNLDKGGKWETNDFL